MSIIARFSLPADEFPLGSLLEVRRGIRVRLESVIPTGDATIPYFWVPTADADAVEAALVDSPLIVDVRSIDHTEAETLFRVEWAADVNGLVSLVEDSDGVLLEAEGLGDDWSFRMRFPRRENLSAFYRACVDRGLSIDLEEVNDPLGSTDGTGTGLTDAQREALSAALESGYFAVPREVTLVDLAGRLGISDTALSQRLRRGLTTLLSAALADGPNAD